MPRGFFTLTPDDARRALPGNERRGTFNARHLEVRMFNVGEGEAILVVFPQRRAWIVDCGTETSAHRQRLGQEQAAYLAREGLTLEALVASHPHIDHGGGFLPLLEAGPPLAPTVHFYRSNARPWITNTTWIPELNTQMTSLGFDRIVIEDRCTVVSIDAETDVHLFAGRGVSPYVSLFMNIHYGKARLLFTGDVLCPHERSLIKRFKEKEFRADILKVTHHGSSSGTSNKLVTAAQPGIAIASSTTDSDHRLERDTLARLGGSRRPRRPRHVFETIVDGDIIVRTDGKSYKEGILYEVERQRPGAFAGALAAGVISLAKVNRARGAASNGNCG